MPASSVLGLLLLAALPPAVVVDVRCRRIPDAVTVPASLAAVVAGTLLDPAGQPGRMLAAAAAALLLLVPALARPGGMGMGDVKLAGVLGLCLGPAVAVAVLAALLAGTAYAAVLAVRSGWGRTRRATIPFGPYLAGGGLLALVAGQPLVHAYLGML